MYIGCTQNPRQRLTGHMNPIDILPKYRLPRINRRTKWILKLKRLKLRAIIKTVNTFETLEEAQLIESKLIKKHYRTITNILK